MTIDTRRLDKLLDELELLDDTIALVRSVDMDIRLRKLGYDLPLRSHRSLRDIRRPAEPATITTPAVIVRSFATTIRTDGNQVSGRIVPYGEVTTVDDGNGPYREAFQRGAFRAAVDAPHRVLLDFEHRSRAGIVDVVGHGVELEERTDGLHGSFRWLDTASAETAAALVDGGVLAGLSVGCSVLASGRTADGVVVRTRAHLDHVALCREPAYTGARVLAVT